MGTDNRFIGTVCKRMHRQSSHSRDGCIVMHAKKVRSHELLDLVQR